MQFHKLISAICVTQRIDCQSQAKQTPSEYLLYVVQDLVAVVTTISRLVSELRLVWVNPCVCFKVPVLFSQPGDDAVRAEIALAPDLVV